MHDAIVVTFEILSIDKVLYYRLIFYFGKPYYIGGVVCYIITDFGNDFSNFLYVVVIDFRSPAVGALGGAIVIEFIRVVDSVEQVLHIVKSNRSHAKFFLLSLGIEYRQKYK